VLAGSVRGGTGQGSYKSCGTGTDKKFKTAGDCSRWLLVTLICGLATNGEWCNSLVR